MDFALLATGHETLSLVRAMVTSPDHHLVGFLADDSLAAQILSLDPAAWRLENLADVLGLRGLRAIIIDSCDPESLEVAKQLAANGVAVILNPYAAHGIEFIYQLGLIRDEQPDLFRLYPVRPWRLHPLAIRLQELLRTEGLGRVHQLQWERDQHIESPATLPALLTAGQIDEALMRDADLLKFLSREFDQVTALQTGDDRGIVQASVALAGAQAMPAQWICRGTRGPTAWRLTATGDAGAVILSGTDDWQTMSWQQSDHIKSDKNETVTTDWGPTALTEFVTGIETVAASNQWANDLNRTFDLLEGTHRSLRRRRTVELYFDTPSERSNFKTQMTALGCGVLLLTLFAMLVGLAAGILTKELGLPPLFMQIVRVLVFAPLFVFLVLQLGVFLSKPSAGQR